MVSVYAEAYGCSSNFASYEMALGLLKATGFEIVEKVNEADLNLVFTCSVKVPTVQRMIYRIQQLSMLRKPLIIAGCAPKTDKKLLEKINKRASLLGPNAVQKIVNVAAAALRGEKVTVLEDLREPKLCLPRLRKNPIIGIVPISKGCLSNCSYCSVKIAHGRLYSYPKDLILQEVERAVKEGCKEIHITSQDNASYGRDIGTNLPALLKEVCSVEGEFFVRVGMMSPLYAKQILGELIDVYREEKIFKFLHLPLQSGSDAVLRAMNRGYAVKEFEEAVERFRSEIPQLTLATDVIVGFPGESDTDFEQTLNLVKRLSFDVVNISKFGARPGTAAAAMKQLDGKVVAERAKALHELVKSNQLEINKKWVGWSGRCLVDEEGNQGGTWIGRNFAYKPIVIHSQKHLLGKNVKVVVREAKSNYLVGELINFC